MQCSECDKPIQEIDFRINCSKCGDFCDEECYMHYHDKQHGCINHNSKKT